LFVAFSWLEIGVIFFWISVEAKKNLLLGSILYVLQTLEQKQNKRQKK
jgi:hypothetical protein